MYEIHRHQNLTFDWQITALLHDQSWHDALYLLYAWHNTALRHCLHWSNLTFTPPSYTGNTRKVKPPTEDPKPVRRNPLDWKRYARYVKFVCRMYFLCLLSACNYGSQRTRSLSHAFSTPFSQPRTFSLFHPLSPQWHTHTHTLTHTTRAKWCLSLTQRMYRIRINEGCKWTWLPQIARTFPRTMYRSQSFFFKTSCTDLVHFF